MCVNVALLDGEGTGVGPGDWVLRNVGFAHVADYEQELEELKASVIE